MSTLSQKQPKPLIAGNTDTGFLKTLALIFMVFDHVGKMFFPAYSDFRLIGRLAFPLYCWCLVVGATYSKNIFKYGLRLLVVGLISQPLYMLALNHSIRELNIFFTLLLGLIAIGGIQYHRYGSQFLLPIFSLVIASFLRVDYGWRGVLFILLLYLAKEDRKGLLAFWLAFSLFWGASSFSVQSILGFPLPFKSGGLADLLSPFFKLQGMIWLALPLVYFPTKTGIHMPKWLGYALYPAHLLIIWLLQLVI